MIKIKQIYTEGYDNNFSYILYDEESREGAVIDPCGEVEKVIDFIEEEKIDVKYVINTHSHGDHVEKNDVIQDKYDVPCVMHEKEPSDLKDIEVKDGEKWQFGSETIEFIHTPGHTPGGLCIRAGKEMITGDTLFVGRSGKTQFPGGSPEDMFGSMKKLAAMDDDIRIYPGHDYGDQPTSTIGRELEYNKCLKAESAEEFKSLGI